MIFKSTEVADFLEEKHFGSEVLIKGVRSLGNEERNYLTFVMRPDVKISQAGAFFILHENSIIDPSFQGSYILVNNPKLAYAKVSQQFLFPHIHNQVDQSAFVSSEAKIGKNVFIGRNVVINGPVKIGDNSYIGDNVTIQGKCQIGSYAYVSSNCSLGEQGFSCPLDKNHVPVSIYHTGGLVLGDHVFIGSLSTIQRGTIDDTRIGDHVKISQGVSIGHNVCIESLVRIGGRAHISGSVHVCRAAFIGSGSVITNNVEIGCFAQVGAGAVVMKSIKARTLLKAADSIALEFMEA